MMNFDDNLESKPLDGQNEQSLISSIYPAPPSRYMKLYTDANVRNRCTPPPPKPFTNGQYLMFGQTIIIDDTIIRTLESQGLRRLYPREYDHKRELKKINASILVNFLDLIDVLIRCPDTPKREEKCNDIQLLFITMHHLINELRPHQARESIRVSLQVQKRQRSETTARLSKQIERIQELIKSATDSIQDYNISTILQETIPGNYENSDSNQSEQQTNMNGDSGQRVFDSKNQNLTKMSELDAIMCGLVDEIF